MKTTKKKARIEIIDIAKAITIFLVIMGHTTGNLDTPLFRRVLYSFHMPLFFLLAGLSIKPRIIHGSKAWLLFLVKNIQALAFPYFIWGLIFGSFSFPNILKLMYGSWSVIASAGTLTSLWYLPCLFMARIYVQIVISIFNSSSKNMTIYALFTVIFFAVGFLIPFRETGYFWCCDVAFVAAGFILLGIVVRKQLIILSQSRLSHLFALLVVCVFMFYLGTIRRGDSLELSLMCAGKYGSIFWFLYNSIFGSMIVAIISMIISQLSREFYRPFNISVITYIGAHTMGIFLLHKNILQELIVPLFKPLIANEILLAFVSAAVDLPIVVLLCAIIELNVPQLLGQFPVYEHQE